MNESYYSFNTYLKKKFGHQKIRKIPINAGFDCPNKDGTLSDRGCIFCDQYGSGPLKTYTLGIEEQIRIFINQHPGIRYIAYYQAHSNTYAPLAVLKDKYSIIFSFPDIIGFFIGTRPDTINSEILPLLETINRKIYFTLELGLQSIHEKSLMFLNRNHNYSQFLNTYERLRERGIAVVVHLIIGIPGETRNDMLKTIEEMNRLGVAGIKFHLFHILKSTPLYRLYRNQPFPLMTIESYIETLTTLLEHLDPSIVIHRLTGEREREIFYKPEWALEKARTINTLRTYMEQNQIHQGGKFIKNQTLKT